MKRLITVLLACALAATFVRCGGGDSPATPPGTNTGTLTIKGSPTAASAFQAPARTQAAVRLLGPGVYNGAPTSVQVKMHAIYLSPYDNCSAPVLVQDKDVSSDYQEIMDSPTLFSNAVAPGSYRCMIVKMDDVTTFVPDNAAQTSTGGVCVAGTTYYNDGFKTETPPEVYWNLDNTTQTGEGTYYTPVSQTQYIFITMDNNAVLTANQQINPHQVALLTNPITVAAGAETKGQFVFDFTNQFSIMNDGMGGGDRCWLEGPAATYVAIP
jgi:hypothetical protein